MWERFPPRMRRALTAALEEAGRRGRDEALPEDLLFGLASDSECAAVFMLEHAGISASGIVEQVDAPAHRNGSPARQRASRLSPGALHVLDVAVGEADRLGQPHVGTEHVALALTRINNNRASEVLRSVGLTPDRAQSALEAWIARGMPRRRSGWLRTIATSPALRWLHRPVELITRYPVLLWKLFVGKSLGHPGFVTNPYPLYRRLRERDPVRLDPLAPVWIVTRYDEVMSVLRDPRFKKDPFAAEWLPKIVREQLSVPPGASARSSIETVSMLFLDPPEHTRVRLIFTKAFTPRRLESLRPRIEQICHKRLDRVQQSGAGRMDLIAELAYPLPVTVIAELLGFPAEDYQKIKSWSDDMADSLALNPSIEAQLRAADARDELRAYFDEVVENLKRAPGDNLLSALLAPDVDRLDREELFSNSVLLLAAGHETTTNLIGNGVLALLRHPDQLRDLRDHPELIASAVEELMRFDPPVQWTSRVTGETIELAGRTIPRGQIVLASLGSANRDPKYFAHPDRLDIRRMENRHLSFGSGAHFCLGAALARMEAQIALSALLARFGRLRLARQKLRWRKGLTFRGLQQLLLDF